MANPRPLTGFMVVLLLAAPARADFLDVSTEVLDDGWIKYTYTFEDNIAEGVRSFVLKGDYFDDLRAQTQPTDWIGFVQDGVVSWARDVRTRCFDALVFSFESPHLPDAVIYRVNHWCGPVTGTIAGPGSDSGVITGVKTPEPTSLALLAIGGLGLWARRRWRREPA